MNNPRNITPSKSKIRWIVGALVVFVLIIWSIVSVPPGHVGVYYNAFGGIDMYNARAPGWHFQVPIFQSVYKIKTSRDTINMYGSDPYLCEDDYECDDISIQVPSKEGLLVTLDISVFYKLKPQEAPTVVQELTTDYRMKTIVPRVRSAAREVTGNFLITELYGVGREKLQSAIFERLEDVLSTDGFILEEVLIRDIDLPEQIRQAIEDKQTAEQRSFQKQFEIDLAEKEAERRQIEGEGYAAHKIAVATGDAEALRQVANVLASNPRVLDFKKLEVLEKLYQNPNTKFIALPSDNLVLPMDFEVN